MSGPMQSPAPSTAESEELSTLFPETTVRVRVGRWGHTELVCVKPFSVRQLLSLRNNPQSALELATGKSAPWLQRVPADDIAMLIRIMDSLNAFDPVKLAESAGRDKEGKPYSMGRLAAIMIAAGHDEDALWDYPPKKFLFYAREAIEIEKRREAMRAVLAADGVTAAIAAAFSKEGAQVLREFRDVLLREAGGRPRTEDRRPRTEDGEQNANRNL